MTATRAFLGPLSAEFPASNAAALLTVNARPVLAFDASTAETCYWTFPWPQGFTGTASLVVSYMMASVLAVFDLPSPCGTASGGVLTFDMDPDLSDASANASGTAAEARIKDGDGTVVISGLTVGTSGADVILDSVSITSGQTVTLTSGTITHAA